MQKPNTRFGRKVDALLIFRRNLRSRERMKGTSFRPWAPIAASNLLELDACWSAGIFLKIQYFFKARSILGQSSSMSAQGLAATFLSHCLPSTLVIDVDPIGSRSMIEPSPD